MASNLPIAGFGRSTTVGGLGGPGIATGSSSIIQNPSYETPGTNLGEAVNWTVSITSSLVEYAVFYHPGSLVITDAIPAEQPTLGFSISEQLDGTFIISQATNADNAQEDYEQGWTGNENYLFVFSDPANEHANFSGKGTDDFENGWGNDSSLLDNIDAIASVPAMFSGNPEEVFGPGWPAGNPGFLFTEVPNVVFGTWDGSTFTDQAEIIASNQYADVLLLRFLTQFNATDSFIFTVDIITKDNIPVNVPIIFNAPVPKLGSVVSIPFTTQFGVRNVVAVHYVTGPTGLFSLEGDPGLKLDEHNVVLTQWNRAVFQ